MLCKYFLIRGNPFSESEMLLLLLLRLQHVAAAAMSTQSIIASIKIVKRNVFISGHDNWPGERHTYELWQRPRPSPSPRTKPCSSSDSGDSISSVRTPHMRNGNGSPDCVPRSPVTLSHLSPALSLFLSPPLVRLARCAVNTLYGLPTTTTTTIATTTAALC